MAKKMWQLSRSKYVQIAKNMLKRAHVNYYHGFFLKSDLTGIETFDARDVTVRVIQNTSDIGTLSQQEQEHYEHFLKEGDLVIGAFRQQEFLGFLCISLYEAFLPEIKKKVTFDGAYFWSGHILPRYRNQGLGRILVNKSIEILKNDYAIATAYMMIETDNIPSQKMVAHNGFHPYKSVRFLELGRFTHYNESGVPSAQPV
jgi:ribosomal protein S18 acetylase RimI-like enzyme